MMITRPICPSPGRSSSHGDHVDDGDDDDDDFNGDDNVDDDNKANLSFTWTIIYPWWSQLNTVDDGNHHDDGDDD